MKGYSSRKYAGIPLGLMIRKSIAKTWTYRIRKGTGVAGTKVGELIQDKYPYFVPTSINNTQSAPDRIKFATAVLRWQTILTEELKAKYNRRAAIKRTMAGYNLYIREFILGLV